jgi:emopamil binding protein
MRLGRRQDLMPASSGVRWQELAIVAFFAVNLAFITYMVDLEQLVIADPYHFTYPWWPPRFAVDAVHWWGRTYDPVLMARPVWWKATIWIDALCFGPFYAVAIYAFGRRRRWIRIPALLWSATMLTNVSIILAEEAFGEHRTAQLAVVLLANAAWVAFPLLVLYRMAREEPFPLPRRN